jgi:hypothetical protein
MPTCNILLNFLSHITVQFGAQTANIEYLYKLPPYIPSKAPFEPIQTYH